MKKVLILLFLVCSLIEACKKETPPTSVHGTVTNMLTGEAVKNIPVSNN